MVSGLTIDACDDLESVRNQSLREGLRRCRGTAIAEQFVARKDGEEVGYISLDIREDLGIGVIYEIFVIEKYRSEGIGGRLLAHGERIAADRLLPRSIDNNGLTDQELASWYARKGYVWDPAFKEMEKSL